MRLAVVSFVCLLAAACDTSPEQEARDLCTAVCDCMTASPALVNACIDNCVPNVPTTLSDACVMCVYQYSQTCSDLNMCVEDACQQPQPQP